MSRILLLCFIHGFKGGDNTFKTFPDDLKATVGSVLPDHRVETVVYPRYETKGELAEASQKFLEWLKERVMDLRKEHLDTPWPPTDRQVGVVLVAHSMGGFVASDALFLALDERRASDTPDAPLFPPIQGLLALDTPYNGLSRSMFVYGAFSNYSKVQTVFNVMTALSAGPVALGRMAMARAGKPSSTGGGGGGGGGGGSRIGSSAGWKVWQLVAVRTGTVGAIAAGGVAAYTHRESIMAGVHKVRNMNLNRQSLREGYQSGVDAIGQGLAYINRRNVGESFAWLSAHFTFVGALLKQAELNLRLQRLAGLRGGIGVRDLYVSLGANGYWSGGYFVPERTFCAVPEDGKSKGAEGAEGAKGTEAATEVDETKETKATEGDANTEGEEENADEGSTSAAVSSLFERWTTKSCEDEIQAHISLFKRDKNTAYDEMTRRAAVLAVGWFNNDEPIVDEHGSAFAALAAEAKATTDEGAIRVTDEGVEISDPQLASPTSGGDGDGAGEKGAAAAAAAGERNDGGDGNDDDDDDDDNNGNGSGLPDESPIDIAATASLMAQEEGNEKTGEKTAGKGNSAESAIVVDDDGGDENNINMDTDDTALADSLAAAAIPAEDRATYMRHLLAVAQNAGTGLKRMSDWSSQLPAKMPRIEGLSRSAMPTVSMPSMPAMPSMLSVSMPGMPKSASTMIPGASMFSRSKDASAASSVSGKEDVDMNVTGEDAGSAKEADAVNKAVSDSGENKEA